MITNRPLKIAGLLKASILMILAMFATLTQGSSNGQVYLTISLFWEGSHIREHNLEALKEIRRENPEIKFHHFINPAYFTTGNVNSEKIKSLLSEGDQVGLYISPWRSIVNKAGILFRISPSFWGPKEDSCYKDCGSSVSLSVYEPRELAKIFSVSRELLEKENFKIGSSFAVSGWQNSDEISKIAEENGFKFNFSAIPPSRIERRLHHFPIYQWVKSDWNVIEGKNQAVRSSLRKLVIIPQNGGVVDYNTSQELFSFFSEIEKQKNQEATIYNLAIHQETASTFQPRVKDLLQKIKSMAKNNSTTLTFDWPSYRNKIKPY